MRIFGEDTVLAVARDADDLDEGSGIAGQTKAFADGVFPGPKMSGHRFVDDRDARRRRVVGFRERAAEENANAERFEIGTIDTIEHHFGRLLAGRHGPPLDINGLFAECICDWHRSGETCGLTPGTARIVVSSER